MKIMIAKTTLILLLCVGCGCTQSTPESDLADLTALVKSFLANADKEMAHASFWADDLVYTSSSGERFDKAEIMSGFSVSDESGVSADEEASVVYSGEEIDVRVYGNAAVVAFRLVATPSDGSEVLGYFNTGTFLKRNGVWRAVAWQATKIPQQ